MVESLRTSTVLTICTLSGGWIALFVAFAVRRLHPAAPWSRGEWLTLVFDLMLVYVPLTLGFGIVLSVLVARRAPWNRWRPSLLAHLETAVAIAVWLPAVVPLVEPDLSPLLRRLSPVPRDGLGSLELVAIALGAVGLALLFDRFARGGAHRPLLAIAVLVLFGVGAGAVTVREPGPTVLLEGELPPVAAVPPPVTLLVIDGADLDEVILPMVAAGGLPTFTSRPSSRWVRVRRGGTGVAVPAQRGEGVQSPWSPADSESRPVGSSVVSRSSIS